MGRETDKPSAPPSHLEIPPKPKGNEFARLDSRVTRHQGRLECVFELAIHVQTQQEKFASVPLRPFCSAPKQTWESDNNMIMDDNHSSGYSALGKSIELLGRSTSHSNYVRHAPTVL